MPRVVDGGWVDLRAVNWARWRERCAAVLAERRSRPALDRGSRADFDFADGEERVRPGRMAAWIFCYEERGERTKR